MQDMGVAVILHNKKKLSELLKLQGNDKVILFVKNY